MNYLIRPHEVQKQIICMKYKRIVHDENFHYAYMPLCLKKEGRITEVNEFDICGDIVFLFHINEHWRYSELNNHKFRIYINSEKKCIASHFNEDPI